jgi:phosphoglycolate phosphatase-like HAD superfamily hydrolase
MTVASEAASEAASGGAGETDTLAWPGYQEPPVPAFLFDLDGTLIDSVYQNVIAWRNALAKMRIELAVWRIHRRIGMSGGLFVSGLLRETGRSLSEEDIEALQQDHAAEYLAQIDSVRPLPGATQLLAALSATGVPWAIATSGRKAMLAGRCQCSACLTMPRW